MSSIRVAELFAGVGGFRLGLEGYKSKEHPELIMEPAGRFETIWANQWEPPGTERKQFAWRCYESRFGEGSCVNDDINKIVDALEAGKVAIPDFDLLVGGFPCQDYSVAKPLSQSGGIDGKKGVLWWDIYRLLRLKRPKYVLLENVDRLLKSPASQRGRDFAIMLSCLGNLGYSVEWHVVNSAEYGAPQRRKRVYIYAEKTNDEWDLETRLEDGVLAEALPLTDWGAISSFDIPDDPYYTTEHFNIDGKKSPFLANGVMQDFCVVTADAKANYDGALGTLGDVIVPEDEVPEEFYVEDCKLEKWKYLKGSKKEERIDKKTGFVYYYSEGSMAFPDSLTNPSRTILTGEGGSGASRFKHIIEVGGRYRRLVPDELDQLQGFPKGWTNTGMTDGQRAFCMGNALVVQIPHVIGKEIARRHAEKGALKAQVDGRTKVPRAPKSSSVATTKVMKANKRDNTKPELLVRRRLYEAGLTGYRLQWKVPGRPDIAWPGKKVAIFVNGCFWHRCPYCNLPIPKSNVEYWVVKFELNKQRDERKVRELENLGWKVHIIWECQLKKNAIDETFGELIPILAKELDKKVGL